MKAKAIMAVCVLGLVPALARAETILGAQLPDQARKVAELRYRTSQDWEAALKYYRSVYPPAQYPRKSVVNQPGVKAIHIQNPSKKGWEGLNIYEVDEEVRIYVVPAEGAAPRKKGEKKGSGKK